MRKKSILNSHIFTGSYEHFIDSIFSLVEKRVPSYVCFANVHMLVEAQRDSSFRKVINNATLVAPDGRPLSIFLKTFRGINQERICGMDIMPDVLHRAAASKKSVYFYGTTDKLLKAIVRKAKKTFPEIKIAGYYAPPFKEKFTEQENASICEKIKACHPDLVLVALGCPKQEKWMAENKETIGACMLGLGQAFHIYGGVEKRSPKWMQQFSLEWMYRLYQEPGRLWKRYALTNCYFLFLVAKELLRYTFILHARKLRLKKHVTAFRMPKLASA